LQSLPPALAALGAYRQFMLYVLVPHPEKPGKMQKFPVSPYTGQIVNAHDPAHWIDASNACALATQMGAGYGVAFVFTAADPFFFLDIDSQRNPESGEWSALAQEWFARFPGAACELSQSGTGLHIFGRAAPMLHASRKKQWPMLELYTSGRFVALTGNYATGDANTDCTAALARFVAEYLPFTAGEDGSGGDFTLSAAPVPEWRGPENDDDLIRRALASKSVASTFSGRASFKDLWEANGDVLTATYPDAGGGYNASDVDAALVSHLAFWTGRHGERIERLMRQSALVRDKWAREDYLPRTIAAILARGGDVCQDKPLALPEHLRMAQDEAPPQYAAMMAAITADGSHMAAPDASDPSMRPVDGITFVDIAKAREIFQGCVYVKQEGRAFAPKCGLLTQDRFRVVYGGYTFQMDDLNQRTTRNAWEAFTENQMIRPPMADGTCFRPDLPVGHIVSDAGRTRVNIYEPVQVPRAVGDPAPFLNHLAKVLPDARDRTIFLSYMAACVQHKGVKFQWAPLLQGVEGNGKTLFTRCVAEALGRRYVHWPKASKLSKEFNAWMVGKLLYGVEDIYTPHQKTEVIEELKPMITGGDGLEIEGKGVDQMSMDICGNFMFNSNHKDAVRKTRNDRRFCIFYSPQQHAADLVAWGMTGDYFPRLYAWLKEGGYAIVSEYLHTFPIPAEFNPAGECHRAPTTSSTEEAIGSSLGGVEQQIAEAVAQGRPGFAGGWISSIQLGELLEEMKQGARITLTKRKEMLKHMGYELHRGLPDGRPNNPVQPDGGKPQLFIQAGHPHGFLTVAAEIAKAYTTAQKPVPV
jgi:uncharacterized protein DUF5906/primase/DNA polymerase family protein